MNGRFLMASILAAAGATLAIGATPTGKTPDGQPDLAGRLDQRHHNALRAA